MSLQWVNQTAYEMRALHRLAHDEIVLAIDSGMLTRRLIVANHVKRPAGWLSASGGKMGMKGFFEDEFERTPGFG